VDYPNLANAEVDLCWPSPLNTGYRNQAKYVFGQPPGARDPVLGAYAPRSHTIVDQTGCLVVEPILEQTRQALLPILTNARIVPFNESTRTGLLRYVIMRATNEGRVLVTWVIGQNEWPGAEKLAQILVNQCPWVAGVLLNANPTQGNALLGTEEHCLIGQAQVEDVIGDIPMRLAARSFFQANRRIAHSLYTAVRDAALVHAPFSRIVDVYAGAGGIALALTHLGGEVIAIEENPATTQAAEAFLSQRNHPLRFLTGDAAMRLGEIDQADLVVLNPPRKGCDEAVLNRVCALAPRQVIYISCDPETLARDLSKLVQGGFVLSAIRPFDMMPQTPHVETLAVLVKETNPLPVASKF
jgi:23S rRNA (uracil1939-C5)-methyltransferase